MDRRWKNRAGFSHVRICGLGQTNFSPSNICLYIIVATLRTGVAARIRCGYIFTYGKYKTRLKLAQTARHCYDAICAHNLHGLYHIEKFQTDRYTLFDDGKMCECTQIFHVKM